MKNLKTFSLVAAIAICALCLFDFDVTDGELWLMGERHENVSSVLLSCVGSCAFLGILLTYFLLTRKEHGFGSWVGVAATGFGILSAVLYMMYLSEIDSAAFKNGDYEERDIENLLLMAVMFIVICQFTILAAVGSLASFAKTDAMKWIVAGLIVAHVLPHIEHILAEFFKPEFSDYEHWDNAHEKYELAREAYKERCEMFHTIVGYLPNICWAIYFFYLAFKKDDAPQVEVAAVQGSVPKPATLVNPVAVSEPPVPAPAPRKRRLWLWVTLIAAVVVGAVTYFMWPSDANGHEYVDLGLPSGLKWATCNIGASSPEEYGDYYAWGEVNTKKEYTEDNSFMYGTPIDKISGNPRYDVARAKWGGSWRMPTREEFEELIDNCTWEWTTKGGHKGYKVTGRNGNSIFLPAAGYRYSDTYNAESYGYYWSATPGESDAQSAYYLSFYSGSRSTSWDRRDCGLSVRPVSD